MVCSTREKKFPAANCAAPLSSSSVSSAVNTNGVGRLCPEIRRVSGTCVSGKAALRWNRNCRTKPRRFAAFPKCSLLVASNQSKTILVVTESVVPCEPAKSMKLVSTFESAPTGTPSASRMCKYEVSRYCSSVRFIGPPFHGSATSRREGSSSLM